MILPVVMAGGSGSRLWPMSRTMYPKQFLNLVGDNTMIQDTFLRISNVDSIEPIVICNNEHRFLVAEQLNQINLQSAIILEPEGRNTAPAIALAAFKAIEKGEDPTLLVLAADHLIQNVGAFEASISKACNLAEQGKLVSFGVVADKPETGYGYIKRGNQIKAGFEVAEFVEKPDQDTAERYLASGDYYWNSGMFVFKASCYLNELKAHRSDIYSACEKSFNTFSTDLDFIRVDAEVFAECPSESIDYAVMEKTEHAAVVPLDAGWSDIGAWSAILDVSSKDNLGNACKGDVVTNDTHDCLIYGEDRLVSTVGLKNVIVIDTKDALLVADKSSVQDVKKIVEHLKSEKREEWKIHREVYRPWGKYDAIDQGQRYQVKRITVNPGAKLSVQKHHHRAEHWIVVSGTARVTNGAETFLVTENESTYIPIGQVHALENPGKVPLELIEVQTGSYLGEDDIVRLEDNYGRVN